MNEMPPKCAGPPPEVQKRPGFRAAQCRCYRPGVFKSKDDHNYCIFHLPTEDKKSLGGLTREFEQAFRDEAKKEKPWFTEFNGMVFPAEFRFPFGLGIFSGPSKAEEREENKESVNPKAKTKIKELRHRLKYPSPLDEFEFKWSIFGDGADFSQVKFGKRVSFEGAMFRGASKFKYAIFGTMAIFRDVLFLGKADFGEIIFGPSLSFENATFIEGASFNQTHFGNFSSFVETTFYERANFTKTTFEDGAEFDHTCFEGIVDFSNMVGRHGGSPALVTFVQTQFNDPAFFHRVNLCRSRFFGVDLRWVSFLRANFEDRQGKTRFVDCQWATTRRDKDNINYKKIFNKYKIFRRPGRILFDELLLKLKKGGSFKVLKPGPCYKIDDLGIDKNLVDISFVEDVALKFKASLEASRDPIPAGDFHFSVMEMKREKAKKSRKLGYLTLRHLALLFYRGLSGYGERPLRSLFWFTFSIIAFWLLYLEKTYLCWKQALYLSWYHTLPFKLHASLIDSAKKWFVGLDPYWGVVTGIQTFIGTTLFAFLVLALRNRFKR